MLADRKDYHFFNVSFSRKTQTFRTLWCIGKPQKIMLIVTQITEVIVEYIPGFGFIEIRRIVRVIERK